MMLLWLFVAPLAACAILLAADVIKHWVSPWQA